MDPFEPAAIKIMLKKDGAVVAWRYFRGFNNFIEVDDTDLLPGDYEILIDPLWNKCAETDPAHKVICVDILCKQKLQIFELNRKEQ